MDVVTLQFGYVFTNYGGVNYMVERTLVGELSPLSSGVLKVAGLWFRLGNHVIINLAMALKHILPHIGFQVV